MGRAYRWLGGIGYILCLIPLVNLVGLIMVAIAWIMMGKDAQQGVFKATGILMIVMMVLSAVSWVMLIPMMGFLGPITPLPGGPPPTAPPPGGFPNIFALLGGVLILAVIIAALGLATFILELISHFRAANVYGVAWFRRAGWMRIIALIITIIMIPVVILMAPGLVSPGMPSGMFFWGLGGMMGLLILPGIIALIAVIFSAIAFFSVPEIPPTYYPPPPPPPQSYMSSARR